MSSLVSSLLALHLLLHQSSASLDIKEFTALESFYQQLSPVPWTWQEGDLAQHWDFAKGADPCGAPTWEGLTCMRQPHSNDTVIGAIALEGYGLTGELPSALAGLGSLTSLSLGSNQLQGVLPAWLFAMTQLQVLRLQDNSLEGPIPPALAELTNLVKLSLYTNPLLHGPLPNLASLRALRTVDLSYLSLFSSLEASGLLQLPALEFCYCYSCHLEGSLPDTIAGMTALQELGLPGNRLSGCLPPMLGSATALSLLDLHGNRLTGPITGNLPILLSRLDLTGNRMTGSVFSTGLGGLQALTFLSLAENSFCGSLPDSLWGLASLEYLKLYGNSFSSSIPSKLSGTSLPALKLLDLSTNSLSGTIPSSLATLTNLETMRLGGNRLVGILPPSLLSNMLSLDTLELWANALSGPVPTFSSRTLQVYNLQNNNFTGPLSSHICSSPALRQLTIDSTSLSGLLPTCLKHLANLQVLSAYDCRFRGALPPLPAALLSIDLSNNFFRGPIPTFSPEARKHLLTLQLAGNSLSGTIPSSTWLLSAIAQLNLANNVLSGTIAPEAGNTFTALTYLSLAGNRLVGLVPSSLARCTKVTSWNVGNNALTGKIPSFFSLMNLTRVLDLSGNKFSGPIPSLHFLFNLEELYLGGNALTSSLPTALGQLSGLRTLFLSDNDFQGSIPTSFGGLQSLRDLDLSHCGLVGAVPLSLSRLRFLTNVLLHGNMLTNAGGGGWSFLSPTTQTMLRVIDLSHNQFSGSIPVEFFHLPSLQVFAAGANCLHGSVPLAICSATALESLVLDGATSGPSCKRHFWPRNSWGLDGVYSLQDLAGTIPDCLFALPALKTLHLGGNGLAGHIPKILLPPLLRDLSLSHNKLSGEIPETIQLSLAQLTVLDLSFNRLRGQLRGQVEVNNGTSTTAMSVIVNALSGPVPASYQAARNVSLLDGNLFSCDAQRSELPQFDPYLNQFQCGSDVLNIALASLLCGTFVLAFLVFVLLGQHSRAFRLRLQRFIDSTATASAATATANATAASPGHLVVETLQEVRRLTRATSALVGLVLLLLVPVYGSFSVYFGIVDKQAAWSMTAAWKKGQVPAAILVILWTAILVANVLMVLSLYYQSTPRGKERNVQNNKGNNQERLVAMLKSPLVRILLPLRLLMLAVINVAVVLSVNVMYVRVLLTGTIAQQNAAVVGLSAFKSAWSHVWICAASRSSWGLGLLLGIDGPAFSELLEEYLVAHCGGPLLETCLEVFNDVLAPCVVTLLTDNTCFRQTLYMPPIVTTRYSYSYLSSFNFSLSTTDEVSGEAVTRHFVGANLMHHEGSTSYTPPYAYSYKCGSVLVQQFTPVFLIDAVQEIVLAPMVAAARYHIRAALITQPSWGGKLAELLLAPVPPVQAFFQSCIADLLLVLTFGVLCPFLALAKLISMLVRSALLELDVLNHVERCEVDEKLVAECAPLQNQHLYQARFLFLSVPSAFLSFFSTDIAGYHDGVDVTLWAPITMGLLPPVLLLGVYLIAPRWLRDDETAGGRRGGGEEGVQASSPLHDTSLSWLARLPQGSPLRPRYSLGLPPPGLGLGSHRLSYTLQNAPADNNAL